VRSESPPSGLPASVRPAAAQPKGLPLRGRSPVAGNHGVIRSAMPRSAGHSPETRLTSLADGEGQFPPPTSLEGSAYPMLSPLDTVLGATTLLGRLGCGSPMDIPASVSFPTHPKGQPPPLRQLRPISQRRGQNLPLVRRRTPFSTGAAKVLRMGSHDDRGFKHCDGRPHLGGRAPPHRINRWSRTGYEPDKGLLVDPSLLTVSRSRLVLRVMAVAPNALRAEQGSHRSADPALEFLPAGA
jgi:hypothetical protein